MRKSGAWIEANLGCLAGKGNYFKATISYKKIVSSIIRDDKCEIIIIIEVRNIVIDNFFLKNKNERQNN